MNLSVLCDPILRNNILLLFRIILAAMSAIARLAVSSTGRQVVMRLSQPSVAGVRFLQTSQTSRDIDSGDDIQTPDRIFIIVLSLQLPSSLVLELPLSVWPALGLVSAQCSDP